GPLTNWSMISFGIVGSAAAGFFLLVLLGIHAPFATCYASHTKFLTGSANAIHLAASEHCDELLSFDDKRFSRRANRLSLKPTVRTPI
ncbi:MAG: hypothetical protein Q7J42_08070, partial [Sulfuritalea sp.]|nr:hypothetical protein [Sulfuritalea sp.]